MDVHVYFHGPDNSEVLHKLGKLELAIGEILRREDIVSRELDALTTEVNSAILLLQGLSAQITAMKEDSAMIQSLADNLHSAVSTYTPADAPTA